MCGAAAGGLFGFSSSRDSRFSSVKSTFDSNEYAFFDDFEDGDISSDPQWKTYLDEGNFSASVVDQPALPNGSKALRVVETTGGATSGIIGWKNRLTGWNDEWTLSGAFYTENVPLNSRYQTHNVRIGKGSSDYLSSIVLHSGFRDGGGNSKPFGIAGDLIDEVREVREMNWQEDTLYQYELSHDGNGVFTARIWTEEEERPESPDAKSVGDVPSEGPLSAGVAVNGALGKRLNVDHSFIRLKRGGNSDQPSEPSQPPVGDTSELQSLLDRKSQLISQIRSNVSEIEEFDNSVDQSPEEFVDSTRDLLAREKLTAQETDQYSKALDRLIATEKVTKTSSSTPVSEIVTRTGNAIINAVITIGLEAITFGVGRAATDQRALKLVGEQVAAGQKSVLKTFAGKFGSFSTSFDDLTNRRSTDFGKMVEEYIEENPRKYRKNNGITKEQREVFLNALKEESITGVANLAKTYNKLAPDGLISDLQDDVERFKKELNEFMFRYYWFGSELAEYDFTIPSVDVPEEFGFSLDLSWIDTPWLNLPLVPDELDFTDPIGRRNQQSIQRLADSYRNNIKDLTRYADLLDQSLFDAGIENTLTDSVALLEEKVEDEDLDSQDPAKRNEVVGICNKSIQGLTSVSNSIFELIGTILDGILLLSVVIGLAIILLYAILVAVSLAGGVSVAAVPIETGVLFTLLSILGAIDVFLVATRVVAIGGILSVITQIHNTAAISINFNKFMEVS
jgi:hypothetical protein